MTEQHKQEREDYYWRATSVLELDEDWKQEIEFPKIADALEKWKKNYPKWDTAVGFSKACVEEIKIGVGESPTMQTVWGRMDSGNKYLMAGTHYFQLKLLVCAMWSWMDGFEWCEGLGFTQESWPTGAHLDWLCKSPSEDVKKVIAWANKRTQDKS
jgi:hypothetical protein